MLRYSTCGILGDGTFGRAVGELARAFGMTVVAHSRCRPQLARALAKVHYLVVALPLTDATRHVLNAELVSGTRRPSHTDGQRHREGIGRRGLWSMITNLAHAT